MAVAFVRSHTVTSDKAASTTTVNLAISTATSLGNVLVAYVLYDNAATASKPLVSSIARAAGETNAWVPLGAVNSTSTTAGAFASGSVWAIRTSVVWPVANYAVTLDNAVTMKATLAQEFSGALAALRSTSGTNYSTTTTAASASTTGTSPVVGDLAVGFIFGSNVAAAMAGDNDTTAGSWSAATGLGTTGGSAATNNFGVAQYKILTAATAQTLNNSALMSAGNGAIVAILQQYVAPSITQAGYGFYADGTESGSTALAGQDTTPTVDTSGGDVNTQLRVRLQATTAVGPDPWDDFQLQWEKNSSGTWMPLWTGPLLDTSTAYIGSDYLQGPYPDMFGQQFVGDGSALTRLGFRLHRGATPTGTVSAHLYASDGGSFGTGNPVGSPIATSATVADVASLPTVENSAWTYFDFDAVPLTSGARYFAVLSTTVTVAATVYYARGLTTAHPGVGRLHSGSSVWSDPFVDYMFEAYSTASSSPIVAVYNSPNLTDGAATTNRLTGGTGTFTAGKVSEDGLVDDLGWAGNNYTELLYSLTFKQADLSNGDTLRFRVLRNGATTGLTFTSVPTVTIGSGGPANYPLAGTVAGTATTSGTIGLIVAPVAYPLAGIVAGATASIGNPAAVHPLAGASAGTTTTSGAINLVGGAQAYPLDGTVTATATTTGAILRLNLAVAATVAGATATSGDPTAVHPLAGPTAGTATTSGAIAQLNLALAATVAATSTAAGAPAAVHPVAGTATGTTTAAGTFTAAYALAGVDTATGDTVGNLTAAYPLAGAVPGVSATSGTPGTVIGARDYPLDGSLAATTTTVGDPAARHPMAGVSAATSTTAGDPGAVHPLAGTLPSASGSAGTLATATPLAGVVTATTTTTGSVAAIHPLDAVLPATSTTIGSPAAVHPMAATTAAISATQGTINLAVGPQDYPVAGVLPATTTTSGNPRAIHPLDGAVPGVSATIGTIGTVVASVSYPLAGVLAATTTTAAGALRANLAADGLIAGIAATSGDPRAIHPMAGINPATSTTTGDPARRTPLAGAPVAAVTATVGTFAPERMSGTVAATSASSGTIRGRFAPSGTVTVISGTVGSLYGYYTLAGTTDAVTETVGTLAARRVLAGTVAGFSTTYGRITPRGYFIPRPNDGRTGRPDTGTTARPDGGRTIRPDTGTTARADAGTITRPRELEHA